MKILRKIILLIPLLSIGLCLLSCEDSYMMRKFKEKKAEPVAAPQAPSAPAPGPQAATTPETVPSADVPAAPSTAPSAPATDTSGSDKSLSEKLNAYIACINRTKPRTLQSRERYLSWVDEKTGPSCKERYISYGLYTLYEDGIQKCQHAVELGAATPPALPKLQQAAEQLTAAFTELVPLTQKASDYYDQEDYKDDQCAKAKAMHPQLMAAFQRFIDADAVMSAEITPLQRQMDQKELAQLDQQGKKLQYLSKKLMVSSELLMAQVPKQITPNWSSAGYVQDYGQVETDYQALQDYLSAHTDETGRVFWMSAFSGSAKDFYTQAKFLKRDLAAGTKLNPDQVNKLVDEYNRMVSDGNNLRF